MCIMTRDLEVLQKIFPIKSSGGEKEKKDRGACIGKVGAARMQ